MKPSLERLKEILKYDPVTGKVCTLKGRALTADQDGLVTVFDRDAKKPSTKYKLERVAYFLAHDFFPREDQKVLHKNLDTADNRAKNLLLVSRSVFRQIKEAERNLEGAIKIIAHPVDMFSYILLWFDKGVERSRIFGDIGVARRYQVKLQLKYSKILTKYCLFDS